MPAIATVPLTQPWFLGVANIRGNLYSVVDFAGFVGRAGDRRARDRQRRAG